MQPCNQQQQQQQPAHPADRISSHLLRSSAIQQYWTDAILCGTKVLPKVITNDTVNLFLNCNQHFRNFKP